jgi:hypothetical protein
MYIIEYEPGVYAANGDGIPSRTTLVKDYAKQFRSKKNEVKDYAIGSTKCKSCEYYAGKGKDKQGLWIECKSK